jgi:DNA-binding CsgD family transcriptional regulator
VSASSLSGRELELLRRVAGGASYRQVARLWGVSEITVRGHGHRVLRKLGANSIAHAVHLAHCEGLLRPERHGDHAGYEAHRRRGEVPCPLRRTGERAYRNGRKARSAAESPERGANVVEPTRPANGAQSAA